MAALQYVDVAGYDAILFRRTYRDLALPEALMDVAAGWLGSSDASWSSVDARWTFPSSATLSFGYLASSQDRYRYQSAAFQYIGFDELTQFDEHDYRYLFSRLRRKEGVTVPLRMRAATNPGGVGHDWVRSRFIDVPTSDDRVFIPALLSDNPHLDRASYERSLSELDPITRSQLLAGDWTARQVGPMFAGHWFEVVDAMPPMGMDGEKVGDTYIEAAIRYWDLAATRLELGKGDPDWTVGALVCRSSKGLYYVADIRRIRGTPKEVEQLIRHTGDNDPQGTIVFVEREPGSAGKAYVDHLRGDVMPHIGIYEDRVTGDKVMRAAPFASHAEAGFIKLVRGSWNHALLDELEGFPIGAHDDQVDAVGGAYRQLAQQAVTYTSSPF